MYFVGPNARNLTERPMSGVSAVNEQALDAIRNPGPMTDEAACAWRDIAAQLLAQEPEDAASGESDY